DHPEDVPVRKRQRVAAAIAPATAATRAKPVQRPIRPRTHLVRLLAVRAAVLPQAPPGPLLPDLGRGQPFVVAVVPLAEVIAHHGTIGEAGQLAGLPRSQELAGQDEREVPMAQ